MDTARQLAQLRERVPELVARRVEQPGGRRRVGVDLGAGEPELQRQRDEALLGAVVQVALDSPPGRVARRAACSCLAA